MTSDEFRQAKRKTRNTHHVYIEYRLLWIDIGNMPFKDWNHSIASHFRFDQFCSSGDNYEMVIKHKNCYREKNMNSEHFEINSFSLIELNQRVEYGCKLMGGRFYCRAWNWSIGRISIAGIIFGLNCSKNVNTSLAISTNIR